MKNLNTKLYFITDSTNLTETEFLLKVESALNGGVTILQLREKDKTTREYISLAEKVHALTQKYKIPLIIDDRIDVAMAVNAEGVHLGQSDMLISTARHILGDRFIIGATAKTVEQAVTAYTNGADYLGVGAIFPTTTKVKTVITPISTLQNICKAVPIPVNAIGGLNENNIDILKNTDIAGICVVSAIMKSPDPKKSTMKLIEKSKQVLKIY